MGQFSFDYEKDHNLQANEKLVFNEVNKNKTTKNVPKKMQICHPHTHTHKKWFSKCKAKNNALARWKWCKNENYRQNNKTKSNI